jgi:hypothetical protein
MRSNIFGPAILAAGGVAWLAVAIAKGLWMETLICGSIAAGFVLVGVGLLGTPRPSLVAWGFGVEAAAAASPWLVYGGDGLALGTLWATLSLVGFLAAAYGAVRGSMLTVRLGVAASIPLAVANVVANEFGGTVNLWSPGNVLFLVGMVWTSALWSMPAPPKAAVATA